ncbi:MAG: hypothetical protein AAF039_10310 [Bacteroidota bacterium]
MKSIKTTLVLTLLFSGFSATHAQKADALVTKTQVINASSDQVWERLRKLDKIEELTPDFVGGSWIKGSIGVGAVRSCSAVGQTRKTAARTRPRGSPSSTR